MNSEPAVLPDAVREAILRSLPEADLDHPELLGKGIATTAYRFTDRSGSWVARVCNEYPEPWTWRGGRRYEVPLLRELNRLGMPVARDPFEVPASDGRPVAIVERAVDGTPVTDVPAERRDVLAAQLADFLTRLHSIPVEFARSIAVPEILTRAQLREAFGSASHRLDQLTRTWIEHELARLDRADPPLALIHADFRPDHWYRDQSSALVGVIDFGDTAIDDPALDFARVPEELLERLVANYQGPAPDGLAERARIYRGLHPLFELLGADEVEWWDGDEALRQLTANARAQRSTR